MSTVPGPSEQPVAAPDGLNGCSADSGEGNMQRSNMQGYR
jgi:hypothetical protein